MVSTHDDDDIAPVYDHRLASRLLGYARPHGWLVTGAVTLLLLEGALQLVGPLLTREVIDVAIPARDAGAIARAAMLFAASLVVSFIAQFGETVLTARLGQSVMHDLRTQLFAKLQRLPIPYYDRTPVGRMVTRVTSDVEALNEMFTAGVVSGLGDLFTLLAIGTLMLIADWRLALSAFAVIPFVYLTSHFFRLKVRVAYREIRAAVARINTFLQERVSGMHVVQLFGRQRDETAAFDALNRAHLDVQRRSIRYYAVYFPAVELLTTVALAAILVAGAERVGAATLTVGTVAAFLQLVRRFFQPLQDLADKFNTLQQAMAASERIFALLDEPEAGVPAGHAANVAEATAERRARGVTVTFDDVWFHYDRSHDAAGRSEQDGAAEPEWVLRGVRFTARPGETVALVGHTGAGKTTIVNLLLRFYDPQRGRILIDGVDIRDMPVQELRALIGYVQQDIFLFAGDIASNIRLANPLDDAAVEAAAARVGADRVIRRLPDGLAHRLGERGRSVSVGERQLLSFARAIAADPAVLVLDEATSAVDSEVEREIQGALETLMEGRTTIAIAHRLSTIVHADEILVLHHGEVRERGTHAALLAGKGLYERLYRLQQGTIARALDTAV
ncbi:MAG TPA: ABC transporter ATP-binding protein [Gemmatimonadaceae bacterium]|nr:ABC transporter ATP-binding protein [Gemmatimonadaceae bacterium]